MQLSCMSIQLPIELNKAVNVGNLIKVSRKMTESLKFQLDFCEGMVDVRR